jgi:AraC-like DNA-binding protein
LNVSDDFRRSAEAVCNDDSELFRAVHAVQSYRERLPEPSLARHVSTVWIQQVAADGPAYEHRTVPNGAAEISYALGSDAVTVAGPRRRPAVDRLAPGSTVVGIRFRPGVTPTIVGPPTSELVDEHVELDRLWGGPASGLAERLAEAGSPDAAVRLLELEVARRSAEAIDRDPLVTAAIHRLQPWRPDDVATWADGLYISTRQLRRRFVAALGFGPKALQRILRFQGFLALSQARHGNGTSLARLATLAGYADQAHLTRESSDLTGLTPRTFLEEMWASCGTNHDHEASFAGIRGALLARHQAVAA